MFQPTDGSDDLPLPPTLDEMIKLVPVPLITLLTQPTIEERGFGTNWASSDGGRHSIESMTLSFTLWRNPHNRADPINLALLTESQQKAFDTIAAQPLPSWIRAQHDHTRYPTLRDAVKTTHLGDSGRPPPLAAALTHHMRQILTPNIPELPGVRNHPSAPIAELSEQVDVITVLVDGIDVPGISINTDPDVYGIGTDLGDRRLTAVVQRAHLPHITVAFQTHPVSQLKSA